MKLSRARAIVDYVLTNAAGPVSVFVADPHGELVAAAVMDGAAPDTRLNAQRKAYTAARSDATSTRELAEKARADPVERASFDPFFTFFAGGVAVFEDGRRIGAIGVSGLPGDVDEQLALAAVERTSSSSAPMAVRRIMPYHESPDFEATRAFYTRVLGLEEATFGGGYIGFASGPAQVVFAPPGVGPVLPDMGVDVDSREAVDVAHAEAVRAGHEVIYGPVDEPWGVRRFFLRDPHGVVISVLAHE